MLAAAGGAPAASAAPTTLLGWVAQLWPFPAVVSSTLLIAWATEVASFFVSRGMALAVLAFLQVLPEFAVEAVIAANAASDPSQLQFVTANFTGANRILVGLALPLIVLITAWVRRSHGGVRGGMRVPDVHSVEVLFLLIPSTYSLLFFFTNAITLLDTVVLTGMYGAYMWLLSRLPAAGQEEKEELHGIPAKVVQRPEAFQKRFAVGSFLLGGAVLFVSVESFYHNTLALAALLGISAYFLLQWFAPLLSEFPEFITTTYWSRRGKGEVAMMNVVSAKINQWTLLIAMIPLVFAVTNHLEGHGTSFLPLDPHQQVEVLLTAAQGLFAVVCLFKMRFLLWEAGTLLFLWGFQLVDPVLDPLLLAAVPWIPSPMGTGAVIREWVTIIYFGLIGVQAVLYGKEWRRLVESLRAVWRTHIRPGAPAPAG